MQSSRAEPKVLIIGAGLGGLTLAQGLRHRGIPFEIFERDDNKQSRGQGWAVAIHRILPALREIAHPDAPPLESVSVTHGFNPEDWALDTKPAAVFYDGATGECKGSWEPAKGWIRANRAKLRMWLETGIDVQWKKRYVSHEVDEDGLVTAYFEDGTTATGNVIVGADGVSSRVREQIFEGMSNPPTATPIPIHFTGGLLTLPRADYERQMALGVSFYIVNTPGDNFRLSTGCKSLSADWSTAEFYWFLCILDEHAAEHLEDGLTPAQRLESAKKVVSGLDPKLQEVVQMQPVEGMFKPWVLRDIIPQTVPGGPATLLGDAIHAMSFFEGEGAHHAMTDALALVRALGATGTARGDIERTLRAYEEEMVPRATAAVRRSRHTAVTFDLPASMQTK